MTVLPEPRSFARLERLPEQLVSQQPSPVAASFRSAEVGPETRPRRGQVGRVPDRRPVRDSSPGAHVLTRQVHWRGAAPVVLSRDANERRRHRLPARRVHAVLLGRAAPLQLRPRCRHQLRDAPGFVPATHPSLPKCAAALRQRCSRAFHACRAGQLSPRAAPVRHGRMCAAAWPRRTPGAQFFKMRNELYPHRTVRDVVSYFYFWKCSRDYNPSRRVMKCLARRLPATFPQLDRSSRPKQEKDCRAVGVLRRGAHRRQRR